MAATATTLSPSKRTRKAKHRPLSVTDPRQYIAQLVAEARRAAGLSQTQVAERMHTSAGAVGRIEDGANTTVETLANVAQALGAELVISFVPATPHCGTCECWD